MKKYLFVLLSVLIVSLASIGICYAGSVPEDLLSEDNAQLYFGEIYDYHETTNTAIVIPSKIIKGNVVIGAKQTLGNCAPVGIRDIIPIKGEICLIAYYDEVNPIHILKTTSDNLPTLKIKNIEGMDMWERLQEYINDGSYEKAEIERREKLGLTIPVYGYTEIPFFALYTKTAAYISFALILLYIILSFLKMKWSEITQIILGCVLTLYGIIASGGAKHYFLYKLYEKWGDVFDEHIREFIPWAIAEYSKDILILGVIVIILIIIGASLTKKGNQKHISIYVVLSFVGVMIISIVLSFFSINKMFDIGAHIETSIDELYKTKDKYMSTLMDFFQHDGAQIISYEVISQEKEGDGYVFEVRHMYKDNTLVEGKRYVEKINSDWIVYLSKEPSLRAFKLIEVPKDQ